MTQKDYEQIGKYLKKPYMKFTGETAMIETIQAVMKALEEDNPHFSPIKFLDSMRGE